MSISDSAINEITTKYGAVLTHSSGHNSTSPTLIYTFPKHSGYQLAIRRNKNELTVYLNAKTRNGKSCEQFIESSSIKKRYPNIEGINPSNSLLNTDHAPYLTPKRHKLLLIKVAPSDFSELIAKYLDVQEVPSESSNVISVINIDEKSLKNN